MLMRFLHDDVIKWKHFPRYWPFVRGIHGAGNSPVTSEFPSQRPVTQSVDVFFDLRLNKRLSKQSCGWWFETPSCPLWRHCNAWNEMELYNPTQEENHIAHDIRFTCGCLIVFKFVRVRICKIKKTKLVGNWEQDFTIFGFKISSGLISPAPPRSLWSLWMMYWIIYEIAYTYRSVSARKT